MSTAQWFFPAVALCLSLSFSHAAQLISRDSTGTRSGNTWVGEPFAITPDGRVAAFTGTSSNYVANDTNGLNDIFVHDCLLRRHIWDTTYALHYSQAGVFRGSTPWTFTPDGRYLVFASTATNIVPGFVFTPDSGSQLYVQDFVSNVTTLVTISHDGTAIANGSGVSFPNPRLHTVSSDGRFVSFTSLASNLVTIDTSNNFDVFCRDVTSGTTELITVTPSGDRSLDAGTFSFTMSTNGRFFAFETTATNVVGGIFNTARTAQVYWRDRLAGTSALVSISRDGGFASRTANLQDMSVDGRYVCFVTAATNIVSDPHEIAINNDLFVRDMLLGETWLVSRTTNNTANGAAYGGQFSANGRILIFSANTANLVPGIADANGNGGDIFAHYLQTRSNTIVSASWQGNTGADRFTADSSGKISATGRYILFTSTATNLVPDRSGPQRLYLRDLEAGRTVDPLRSPYFPTPALNEARMAITDTERYIFFLTQTNFDSSVIDTNNTLDLFRAPLYQPKFLSARPMLADVLPNTTYVLQSSIDLRNWFTIVTNVSDSQGQLIYNIISTSPIHFHRLLWP